MSRDWCIASLNGDLDAHRAFLVTYYPEFHLPWERIKSWLIEKTADFQNDPPLWLSHKVSISISSPPPETRAPLLISIMCI